MKKLNYAWILLCLSLLAGGCASLSSNELQYLDRNLKYTEAKPSGLLYKEAGFNVSSLDAVVLHPVTVHTGSGGGLIKSEPLARDFASDLEIALTARIPKETQLSVLRPGDVIPSTMKTGDLDIRVTMLNPGDAFARWFIGVGAGATVIQVEGQIRQGRDKMVMAFADKRSHSGNPTLGINVAALSDEYTCKELSKAFADLIINLLGSH